MNDLQQVGLDRDAIITRCKTDLNFFAAIMLPEVYAFPFPPIFLAVWQMLTDNAHKEIGQDRLALGLPRGFGKTILLKLYASYLVLYTNRRFILTVCNTAPLASNFISDVADMLDSDNCKAIWGDWRIAMTQDNAVQKKFTFRGRPCVLAALGNGGSPRGLNIKYVRPDVILMDDMQSREEAESPTVAAQVLAWMLGTLMKANNKLRCQFIFVGNMYPFEGSILKKLKRNPAWFSFVCGAILADGHSIWPELRSVEDIMEELENDTSMGHPEIFFSEVMNDEEAGSRSGVDISRIAVYKDPPAHLPEFPDSGFVIIDPSVGKKKNDAVAIGAVMIFNGKPVLWDLKVGALNPKEQILWSLKFAVQYGIGIILVESVAYQATLCFWMKYFMEQRGIKGIRVGEIYPGMNMKNSRIISMLKDLTAPEPQCMLHERVKTQFVYQVTHFNPVRTRNEDDILDLLAYGRQAIVQFGSQLLLPIEANQEVVEATSTETFESAF